MYLVRERDLAGRVNKVSSNWISKTVRQSIYNRDNRTCVYCGTTEEHAVLSLDHIEPRSEGGALCDPANLITCCCHCNSTRQTMSLPAFQRYLATHYAILTVKDLSAKVRRMARKPL